jgi:serine/threonine protein kinase
MEARESAPFELWLILEHVPYRLRDWVVDDQSAADELVDRLLTTIRFLHGHGVFHFDAHFDNVVTDGSLPYLTDFGLASDREFALSESERAFLDRHQHYDFGQVIHSVGNALLGFLWRLPSSERDSFLRRFGADVPSDHGALIEMLVSNVTTIASEGILGVSPAYAALVTRYRPVILFMTSFFSALQASRRKNTLFDDARLSHLLVEAGVDVR